MTLKNKKQLLTLLASISILTACQTDTSVPQPSKPQTSQTDKKTDTDKQVSTSNKAETKPSTPENQPQAETTGAENETQAHTQPQTPLTTPENQTSVFPEALLGTWAGQSQQANDVSITFEANGQVTTSAHFDGWDSPTASIAYVSQADDFGNNYYRVLNFEGDFQALMPGITGMGGWGQMVEVHGFKIVNNQLRVVSWQSSNGLDFNWSEPLEFGFTLQKQ